MHLIVLIAEFNVEPILFDIHIPLGSMGSASIAECGNSSRVQLFPQHLPQLRNCQGLFGRSSNRFFECGIDERLIARPSALRARLEFFNYFVVQHDGDAGLARRRDNCPLACLY